MLIALLAMWGRPREGAWIEIRSDCSGKHRHNRRPREGAWIEMTL